MQRHYEGVQLSVCMLRNVKVFRLIRRYFTLDLEIIGNGTALESEGMK